MNDHKVGTAGLVEAGVLLRSGGYWRLRADRAVAYAADRKLKLRGRADSGALFICFYRVPFVDMEKSCSECVDDPEREGSLALSGADYVELTVCGGFVWVQDTSQERAARFMGEPGPGLWLVRAGIQVEADYPVCIDLLWGSP